MPELNPFKPDLYFDFRGVVAVPAKALELKKVFIGAMALLIALLLYDICAYLAALIDGLSVGSLFDRYTIFPLTTLSLSSLFARGIYFLGILLAIGAIMTGSLAISVINVEELRGNRLCSARQGFLFALERASRMFYALIAIALFVLIISTLLSSLGLLARIPFVGEALYSILFVIPGFITSIFILLTIIIFCLSFILLPASAGADRIGETFTAILESFSTVIRQPFRWVGYTAYTLVSGKLCLWLLAGISLYTVKFFGYISALTGGAAVTKTIAGGAKILPLNSNLAEFTFTLWPQNLWPKNLWLDLESIIGVNPAFDISRLDKGGEETFAAYFMALALLLIFAYIWGYALSILATGQAYIYVILRKIRDDYDITAEDPQFMEEEWINPPIEETIKEFSAKDTSTADSADEETATDSGDDGLDDRET